MCRPPGFRRRSSDSLRIITPQVPFVKPNFLFFSIYFSTLPGVQMSIFSGHFRNAAPRYLRNKWLGKLVFESAHPRLSVIANQCAHWCGNPPVRGEMYRQAPRKRGLLRFLVVIVPGSFQPGDCHDQCAHWSRNDSIIFQTPICRAGGF